MNLKEVLEQRVKDLKGGACKGPEFGLAPAQADAVAAFLATDRAALSREANTARPAPRAVSSAASIRRLLPIPATPWTTATCPPRRAFRMTPPSEASSPSRPTSGAVLSLGVTCFPGGNAIAWTPMV